MTTSDESGIHPTKKGRVRVKSQNLLVSLEPSPERRGGFTGHSAGDEAES